MSPTSAVRALLAARERARTAEQRLAGRQDELARLQARAIQHAAQTATLHAVRPSSGVSLRARLDASGFSLSALYTAYFALGGDCDPLELDAYLNGVAGLPAPDRAMLPHALGGCRSSREACGTAGDLVPGTARGQPPPGDRRVVPIGCSGRGRAGDRCRAVRGVGRRDGRIGRRHEPRRCRSRAGSRRCDVSGHAPQRDLACPSGPRDSGEDRRLKTLIRDVINDSGRAASSNCPRSTAAAVSSVCASR